MVKPPVPAFYTRPRSIDDIVNHSVGRTLDLMDVEVAELERWDEEPRLPRGPQARKTSKLRER